MNSFPFTDQRASGLYSRVRQDITILRRDLRDLIHHTAHQTLPGSARGLASEAKRQLMAGGLKAVHRIKSQTSSMPWKNHSQGWIGGATVVGLLAAGVYALCRNSSQATAASANDPAADI
jgi:hypothetical protein